MTGANAVIVAGPVPGGNQFIRELGWRLEEDSAELVLAATLTNVAGPRIHWRPVEGLPLMHVDIPHYSGGKHTLKRLMDVTVAATALLLLAPLLLVLAAIVRADSPGPVLFRQERIGKRGTTFKMLKFRSMVVDAEARLEQLSTQDEGAGVLFKIRGDPRITKCGRWMRKYSLDELPQFWNVLTGSMSLVGPRPPLLREVNGYEQHTRRRLLIKPGITGLWQINGRSDLPWDEAVRQAPTDPPTNNSVTFTESEWKMSIGTIQSGQLNGHGLRPKLRIAVVGAGYWGPNLARNLKASPDWDLVAICDLDVERGLRLAETVGGVAVVESLDELLDTYNLDAVAVATPAHTHHGVVMTALRAGKHVLVEKPLADSRAKGLEMVEEAKASGSTLASSSPM